MIRDHFTNTEHMTRVYYRSGALYVFDFPFVFVFHSVPSAIADVTFDWAYLMTGDTQHLYCTDPRWKGHK